MKKYKILTLIVCSFFSCNSDKKMVRKNIDYHEKCRLLVLEENNEKQIYQFVKNSNSIDELKVTLLGKIKTSKGDTLKIINSIKYFGIIADTKRANGELYIYNSKNIKIGHYTFGSADLVPKRITETNIVFDYDNNICNEKTTINFKDSIPSKIFINCSSKVGDLYDFVNE